MSKIASLALLVVGSGWMNQTISMTRSVELLRPFEGAAEANDFADAVRAELLQSPSIQPIEGLLIAPVDLGDFAAVSDVRLTYFTREYRAEHGLFGRQDTTITTSEEIAEFRNEDSFRAVSDDEED